MRALIFFVLTISTTSPAWADPDFDWVYRCQTLCSQACMDKADEMAWALNDLRNVCDGSGGCGDLTDTYNACESAFSTDQAEAQCASVARQYCMGPDTVRACENAFSNDSLELQCVQLAGPGRLRGDIIGACESAFSNDTSELECVRISSDRRLNVSDVEFCERSGSSDSAELECLRTL